MCLPCLDRIVFANVDLYVGQCSSVFELLGFYFHKTFIFLIVLATENTPLVIFLKFLMAHTSVFTYRYCGDAYS